MSQKLVSYFHAAVPPEFCQSVSEAVLIKHYTTKCSCLFISREHWKLILTALQDSVIDLFAYRALVTLFPGSMHNPKILV